MCKITATTIANDGAAVAKAINSIAAALAPSDPTLAQELTTAANALVAATSNWTTGSVTADINDAAQAVEALLSAIPLTAPYATFVAIAVTALDILLANIGTQSTQTANVVGNAVQIDAHIQSLPENPYRGIVAIRPSVFGIRHALVNRWNQQVEAEPLLKFLKL